MSTVAIIGLGSIGSEAARELAKSKNGQEYSLVGYDTRPETLAALGAVLRPAVSPAAASEGADVVLVAVVNDAQVRDVLTGEGGVLSAATLPRAVLILSTISVPTVFWAEAECAARGVALLDCAVSGHPITSMVGGDDDGFGIVRPVIEGYSVSVIHCGKLGNGMRAKLARNLIIFADWMVAWEGARLAMAAGVPLDKFVQCVTSSDKWVRPHMALVDEGIGLPGGTTKRPSTAAFADKDLRAALALGAELGVDLPAAELALNRFRAVAGLE